MDNSINWEEIVSKKDAKIAELEALVKYYEELFRLSKSSRFSPKSEKKGPFQYTVFGDEEDASSEEEPEPAMETITYTRRKKRKGKRKDDLSRLPVEVVEHRLPEGSACPECDNPMHAMGRETRRELVIVPAQVKVVEHVCFVYSCRRCEKDGEAVPILKAGMPAPLIKGSLASPSAVAYIMYQKYVMCAPLYRLEKDWERQDVSLSRQTMCNWVIRCAEERLARLCGRLRGLLLESRVLHADESEMQVLHEPGKPATSKSYMWLYRTSGDTERHIVYYEYQPSRSGDHPKQFLDGFTGYVHVDGFPGYHKLTGVMTLVCCWVHCRRKFTDCLKSIPKEERPGSIAQQALRRIGKLFHMESLWAGLSPEERHARRLEKSKPKADAFFSWLASLNVLPKSATGRAINYALTQREWLMNVYLDGRTEFSNNRIENSVRPYALGRKNYLFSNSVRGAKASAIIYTVIETAKANGLRPFEYLQFLLGVEPATMAGDIDSLLPWGGAVPESCAMPKPMPSERSA